MSVEDNVDPQSHDDPGAQTLDETERLEPSQPDPYDLLRRFLTKVTSGGLSPLVGYSISDVAKAEVDSANSDSAVEIQTPETPESRTHKVQVLTTRLGQLTYALEVVQRAVTHGYNLGKRIPPDRLAKIRDENPHVFSIHDEKIRGFSSVDFAKMGATISRYGAPFIRQKAFALVDICGFSRREHAEQLTTLYSLTNMLDSSIRRSRKFCDALKARGRFGRNSTGDGYYFWHDGLGGASDVATFMTLVCLMSQCEALRDSGFPIQLRCSFFIGSAFLFYDAGARENSLAPASNAIGAATNGAARLISDARPGQFLINDFDRLGQGDERMTPKSLVAQCNELFRIEDAGAGKLSLMPTEKIRVNDKHGDAWYCYNVCGAIPNRVASKSVDVMIGLKPDQSPIITDLQFEQQQQASVL
jgi:hypothetical protein